MKLIDRNSVTSKFWFIDIFWLFLAHFCNTNPARVTDIIQRTSATVWVQLWCRIKSDLCFRVCSTPSTRPTPSTVAAFTPDLDLQSNCSFPVSFPLSPKCFWRSDFHRSSPAKQRRLLRQQKLRLAQLFGHCSPRLAVAANYAFQSMWTQRTTKLDMINVCWTSFERSSYNEAVFFSWMVLIIFKSSSAEEVLAFMEKHSLKSAPEKS